MTRDRAITNPLFLVMIVLLVLTIVSLPYIGTASPDPWWVLKITPTIYWFTLIASLVAFLASLRGDSIVLTWLSIGSLTALLHSLPKLMFFNPVWTDTYLFVGEVFHVLTFGHIGFGHAHETPVSSLLTAQLSLVTGLSYEVLVVVIPILLLPYLTVIFVYMLSTSILSRKGALIAVLVFLSLFWQGLHFNRASLTYPLYVFTLFLLIRHVKHPTLRNAVVFLILFPALTLGHPGESVAIPSALLIMTFLTPFLSMLKFSGSKSVDPKFGFITELMLSATIWLGWQMWNGKTLGSAILNAIKALDEFVGGTPIAEAVSIGGYTQQYMPIVNLRFYWSMSTFILSLILSLLLIIRRREMTYLLLGSFLIFSLAIGAYTSYAGQPTWRQHTYFLAWPIVGLLIAKSIVELGKFGGKFRHLKKISQRLLLAVISLFIMLMPLLMYSHLAYVYPPASNLAMHDFLTKRGVGYVAVLGGHTVTDYYILKNNADLSPYPYRGIPEPMELLAMGNKNYDIIATTFRVYAKDAFIGYNVSLTKCMSQLKSKMSTEPLYNKIYCANGWHEIYCKISHKR